MMQDQHKRGQVLKFSETEARRRCPDVVVVSLGTIREDKPNGTVTARVLFDGTHGVEINTRTRIRDQERSSHRRKLEAVDERKDDAGRKNMRSFLETGTSWGARYRLEVTCTSTRSETTGIASASYC